MKSYFKKNVTSSFTLIEILIVCALIAFLTAISIVGYNIATTRADKAKAVAIIEEIKVAMEGYKAKTGYYLQQPTAGYLNVESTQSGVKLADFIPSYEKWKSDDIIDGSGNLVDPYGEKFWFKSPGYHNRGGFDIESAGPDMEFGYTHYTSYDKNLTAEANKTHKIMSYSRTDKITDNIKNWK